MHPIFISIYKIFCEDYLLFPLFISINIIRSTTKTFITFDRGFDEVSQSGSTPLAVSVSSCTWNIRVPLERTWLLLSFHKDPPKIIHRNFRIEVLIFNTTVIFSKLSINKIKYILWKINDWAFKTNNLIYYICKNVQYSNINVQISLFYILQDISIIFSVVYFIQNCEPYFNLKFNLHILYWITIWKIK